MYLLLLVVHLFWKAQCFSFQTRTGGRVPKSPSKKKREVETPLDVVRDNNLASPGSFVMDY